jgi:hypothetical protein
VSYFLGEWFYGMAINFVLPIFPGVLAAGLVLFGIPLLVRFGVRVFRLSVDGES